MTKIPGKIVIAAFSLYVVYCISILALPNDQIYVVNITCPSGWVKALNNCYFFNNKDELTWLEARTECNIMDADLMFVRNSEENNWIVSQTAKYQTEAWWVGLVYTVRKTWRWVQAGGHISLINWRHEPDNITGQSCGAINEFGLFSNEFCDSRLGFICHYPINRGEFCVSTTGRWLMTDTACLYISPLINESLRMTWNEAKAYCSKLVTGQSTQLLSIYSKDDMTTLQNLLQTYDTSGVLLPWWTGMHTLATKDSYVWVNGSAVDMSLIQWDRAPSPDRTNKRNCGVVYRGGAIEDMTCDKRAHYICERSAFSGYLNLGCGPWLRAGFSCYLISKGRGYTWSEARDKCYSANSQLIKIDNLDEMFWLQTLELGNSGFWTGLNTRINKGSWIWVDGTHADQNLIPWAQEPNNFEGNENCASIYRLGYYNDLKCDALIGFICEYTKDPGVNCTSGWLSRDLSSCYMFVTANVTAVTWVEAKDKCNDLVSSFGLVAYRLAVNDKDEQAWINGQLLKQPKEYPWFWTGLNDRKAEGVWQYDEDFNNPPNNDVISWAKEPNNMNDNEDCAAVYDGGFFNDINCDFKTNFICERTIDGIQAISLAGDSKHLIKWTHLLKILFLCLVA